MYGGQRIDAAYFELMRSVVAEFATQFAQGGAPQARSAPIPNIPPPPPPPPPAL
ncbi:MAG: hypothetical protein JNM17_07580 [Archangium sp.]|nr:hypothetical protein [Archangium sp.]